MNDIDYEKLTNEALRRIMEKDIPASRRMAAIELYKRGETISALKFLIEQMELYKDPNIHENIKRETCMASAVALGRLKDKQAIRPLFEALGEISRGAAAYALAEIGGHEIEKKLLELISFENKKGIQAILALGLMGNEKVVPMLVSLIEHSEEYETKYKNDMSMELLFGHFGYILRILAAYNNQYAENIFTKLLSKRLIESILCGFVMIDIYPHSYNFIYEKDREIVKKYKWNKHLNSEKDRYVFTYTNPEKWVDDMRHKIVEKIWQEIKMVEEFR